MQNNLLLEGKIALVTGGGRGIGKAIALELAKNGADVIINYNGSEQRAMEVVKEIEGFGQKAYAYKCDVSDYSACEEMVAMILKEHSKVDILINNAGITRDNLILRMTEKDYDDVLNINLKGAFNTIKHLSKNFLKLRGGKIINISSVSGVLGNAGQANYSASKAGLIGLTKSIARELSSRNVCVNAVAPGFVATEMTEALPEEAMAKAKESIPLGRIGEAKDIANAVVFLASDNANYITGQVICVDGGMAI